MLATDLALFFRSTFVPSLRSALAASRGASEHEEFGDRLEGRLKRRLIQDPTPARHHVSTMQALPGRSFLIDGEAIVTISACQEVGTSLRPWHSSRRLI
jgi:hypothetical protein